MYIYALEHQQRVAREDQRSRREDWYSVRRRFVHTMHDATEQDSHSRASEGTQF